MVYCYVHVYTVKLRNRQCVFYVGWSRYTGIIIKFIIEHIETDNIKTYKSINIVLHFLHFKKLFTTFYVIGTKHVEELW